jgi:AraC family transcriptional activator of mtrCDE
MNSSSAPFQWLLDHLELDTSLLHVGRYCGNWQASTHGLARASFHLLLDGDCWLHCAGQSIHLQQGDGVFLLRDRPYRLSSHAQPDEAERSPRGQMQALSQEPSRGVGLVCGFFHFRAGLSQLLLESLPERLVLRAGDPALQAASCLFELIMQECDASEHPSPALLERLSHLLFLYVLRQHLPEGEQLSGLLGLARHPQFSDLIGALIEAPQQPWSLQEMADRCGLSRSAFCKRVQELTQASPGQILLQLRVRLASSLLQQGLPVAEVADRVGYQSVAAFTRAFSKVAGVLPGAYRKARAH